MVIQKLEASRPEALGSALAGCRQLNGRQPEGLVMPHRPATLSRQALWQGFRGTNPSGCGPSGYRRPAGPEKRAAGTTAVGWSASSALLAEDLAAAVSESGVDIALAACLSDCSARHYRPRSAASRPKAPRSESDSRHGRCLM